MNLDRRKFLTLSALTGIISATPSPVRALTLPEPSPKARLRLSCQDSVAPGKTIAEKLDFLEANGFEAFEPHGKDFPNIADELQKALQGRKIKVGVVCGGLQGCLISDQEEERRKGMESLKEVLTAAGALGATGVIMVPARPNQPSSVTGRPASFSSKSCLSWAITPKKPASTFCSNRSTAGNAISCARWPTAPPFVAMLIIPASA